MSFRQNKTNIAFLNIEKTLASISILKMKIKFLSPLIVLALLTACGAKSPDHVIIKFYQLLSDGKTNEAIELMHIENVPLLMRPFIAQDLMSRSSQIQKCGGIKDMRTELKSKSEGRRNYIVEITTANPEMRGCKQSQEIIAVTQSSDGKWYLAP